MTKMIPDEIRPDYFNRCEQIIFDRIKTDFPNNWIAFHSLDLVEQKGTYWSEVDFVIIGPPGNPESVVLFRNFQINNYILIIRSRGSPESVILSCND